MHGRPLGICPIAETQAEVASFLAGYERLVDAAEGGKVRGEVVPRRRHLLRGVRGVSELDRALEILDPVLIAQPPLRDTAGVEPVRAQLVVVELLRHGERLVRELDAAVRVAADALEAGGAGVRGGLPDG